MTRVLVSCPLIRDSIDDYGDLFESHDIQYDVAEVDQQLTESELLDVIDRYDGVLAGDDEFTAEVFERADRLRVVSKWGVGTDSIDQDAARRHGVTVHNTPGAFANEVATVVVGYTIMLARRLHEIDAEVREGNWHCPRGRTLDGRTFGVVGVGSIGSEVARKASALGMDVLGYDVASIDPALVEETGIEQVEFADLCERSDVVSLNCALTPETAGIIDESALRKIGPDGYLVNTARGELVESGVVAEAIDDGYLGGAALDVLPEEPLPPTHPLTRCENVILGSHNAQNTTRAVETVNDRAIENLIQELT